LTHIIWHVVILREPRCEIISHLSK